MNKAEKIFNTFDQLNEGDFEFVVLRKHEFIPEKISMEEDIDIIFKREQREELTKKLGELGFERQTDDLIDNAYLYGAYPHDHFISRAEDLHIDAVYSLAYRSLNKGEWVPVSGSIQKSMMDNKISSDEKVWKYRPSPTDELVHTVCHTILDQRAVDDYYSNKMKELTLALAIKF